MVLELLDALQESILGTRASRSRGKHRFASYRGLLQLCEVTPRKEKYSRA